MIPQIARPSATASRLTRISNQVTASITTTALRARTAAASTAGAMSSPTSPPEAPWRVSFLSHVEAMSSPEFALATLSSGADSSSSSHHPSVRTCIFRGMFASLPVNPKNMAPLNPPLYASDLLTFTTDVRMRKVPGLFSSGAASSSSGGGGPVEASFWVKDQGTQWRVRGTAWVIGPDIDSGNGEQGAGAASVRAQIFSQMRRRAAEDEERRQLENKQAAAKGPVVDGKGEGEEEWSFARELTAHFGNLSPIMRGTFKNPPPGTPIQPGEEIEGRLGQEVADLEDPIARANFRVVVIVPTEVDRADLSDPKRPKRWLYKKNGETGEQQEQTAGSGGWDVVEVWP